MDNNYAQNEPLYGVLGSRENGGQNSQGAGSRMEKVHGAGSTGINLGSRDQRKKAREQGAEEIK